MKPSTIRDAPDAYTFFELTPTKQQAQLLKAEMRRCGFKKISIKSAPMLVGFWCIVAHGTNAAVRAYVTWRAEKVIS